MKSDYTWAALGWFLFVAGLAFGVTLAESGHFALGALSLVVGIALYIACNVWEDRKFDRQIEELFRNGREVQRNCDAMIRYHSENYRRRLPKRRPF